MRKYKKRQKVQEEKQKNAHKIKKTSSEKSTINKRLENVE